MTQQTINGGTLWPAEFTYDNRSGALVAQSLSVTATTDKIAFVFDAPQTGTITGATLWLTANSGASGVDVRLETVNGTGASAGKPTGTLANSGTTNNSNKTVATATTGAITVTFTGSYSATRGDRLALVVAQSGAGTTTASVIKFFAGTFTPAGTTIPWLSVGGTYTEQNSASNFAINYGGTYYWIPGAWCVDSTADRSGNLGSGVERGIQFQLPYPTTITGMFCNYSISGVQADFVATLYDNTNTGVDYTALITRTATGGSFKSNSISYAGTIFLPFNGTYAAAANTTYNLVLRQTSANNIAYHEARFLDTSVAAMLGAMGVPASTFLGITRATTGATTFTTSATQIPYQMGIICNGFDDAAGGGGAGPFSRIQAGF